MREIVDSKNCVKWVSSLSYSSIPNPRKRLESKGTALHPTWKENWCEYHSFLHSFFYKSVSPPQVIIPAHLDQMRIEYPNGKIMIYLLRNVLTADEVYLGEQVDEYGRDQ